MSNCMATVVQVPSELSDVLFSACLGFFKKYALFVINRTSVKLSIEKSFRFFTSRSSGATDFNGIFDPISCSSDESIAFVLSIADAICDSSIEIINDIQIVNNITISAVRQLFSRIPRCLNSITIFLHYLFTYCFLTAESVGISRGYVRHLQVRPDCTTPSTPGSDTSRRAARRG